MDPPGRSSMIEVLIPSSQTFQPAADEPQPSRPEVPKRKRGRPPKIRPEVDLPAEGGGDPPRLLGKRGRPPTRHLENGASGRPPKARPEISAQAGVESEPESESEPEHPAHPTVDAAAIIDAHTRYEADAPPKRRPGRPPKKRPAAVADGGGSVPPLEQLLAPEPAALARMDDGSGHGAGFEPEPEDNVAGAFSEGESELESDASADITQMSLQSPTDAPKVRPLLLGAAPGAVVRANDIDHPTASSSTSVKRGRGRPRKHPHPVPIAADPPVNFAALFNEGEQSSPQTPVAQTVS